MTATATPTEWSTLAQSLSFTLGLAELLAEACPARPWARHAGQRPGRRRRRLAA